jgi:hypothetical protein
MILPCWHPACGCTGVPDASFCFSFNNSISASGTLLMILATYVQTQGESMATF